MSICAVAWDIDGTLVDSEPLHQEALIHVVSRSHVDISDFAPDAFVGVSLPDVWKTIGGRFTDGMTFEDWNRRICEVYRARAHTLKPTPGVREVMAALDRIGVRQIAVSNSSRAVVDTNLEAIGVSAWIAHSVSLDDVAAGKPDPAPYRMGAEWLNLPARQILAVEDSATGLASARAAGLRSVRFNPNGSAADGAADHVVTDIGRVLDLVGIGAGPAQTESFERRGPAPTD